MSDNTDCVEILNTFFSDSVKYLDTNRELFTNKANLDDPVENIIAKFANHLSILKIKENCFQANRFSFLFVSENDVCSVIKNVESSKAYQKDTIPPKVSKENKNLRSTSTLTTGKFPDNLENADITPDFNKLDRNLKSNYRVVRYTLSQSTVWI